MIKPPHPVAVVGYLATMLINPNNHALDGGPPTAVMEREAVDALARMLGFDEHLGHLTSSGTIANLEALFVARETHPGRAIAFSEESHYTHARMGHLLGVPTRSVPADARGRMDLDALAELLARGEVGTVVATLGTTSLGAIDPLDAIVPLARAHGRGPRRRGVRRVLCAARGASPDGLDPKPCARSPIATRWRSTRTSTACSPMGVGPCCSAIRRSAASIATTRPTLTSRRASFTWARSASSARGPAPPRPRCG
ncbi:aminotransferase class I/II-fold pyridoxal phosphate-dependent enzyme [Nannocystis pusilla]|uniref:Aminotransferase class I/II-fold pyridoxal phosphate-dependent enzyme n=1 Tax=Nannocystis pusilla TaxID=889268 RepID=A0A9X3F0F0_9BACT|nr:aminotransferase class I/II-fold pyridoxal phosphate-dependent enzyme [Nannocystis pusilla]MCY1013703.1 aminotransferase class I/II-fold pyridoxal phosphate-dependent enzyme [Nannocystis pusilla]